MIKAKMGNKKCLQNFGGETSWKIVKITELTLR